MFIGHIPEVGKQALAGVGVTAPVILAISAFAAGVHSLLSSRSFFEETTQKTAAIP